MKKINITVYAAALLLMMSMAACKPTEKGYRQAYEIARQKEREGMDTIQFEKMQEDSKPPLVEVAGVQMRRKGEFLQIVHPADFAKSIQLKRYNPAVGKYRLQFNACSHTDRLRADGINAMTVQTPEKTYYVIIGTYDDEQGAAAAVSAYNTSHSGQYVAMQEPLLILKAR